MDLNEKTTIPLFAVIFSLPVLVGFVFWLSTVSSLSNLTAKTVDKLEQAIYQIRDDVAYLKAKAEKDEKKR